MSIPAITHFLILSPLLWTVGELIPPIATEQNNLFLLGLVKCSLLIGHRVTLCYRGKDTQRASLPRTIFHPKTFEGR